MLKLWSALEKKFYLYNTDKAALCLVFIAKLLFWWMYAEGYMDSPARRNSFVAFFGLGEDDA